MKKSLGIITGLAIIGVVACTDNAEKSEVDTANTTTTNQPMESGYEIQVNPEADYIDLNTGQQVKLQVDTVTRYIVFKETYQPVQFFIDPTTQDTFDMKGQNVSDVLIKTEGKYMVDETKWKIKRQADGDWKMKDGEGNKIKVDPNDDKIKIKSADGSVEKIDGDKYKSKTDSTKIKSKQ